MTALPFSCIASPSDEAARPEQEAFQVFAKACLPATIVPDKLLTWAKSNATLLPKAADYDGEVLGTQTHVWKKNDSRARIFVSRDARNGCTVWFRGASSDRTFHELRTFARYQAELSRDRRNRVELFREGEMGPGVQMLAYVVKFEGFPSGLMWSAYSRADQAGHALMSYDAIRVRTEP